MQLSEDARNLLDAQVIAHRGLGHVPLADERDGVGAWPASNPDRRGEGPREEGPEVVDRLGSQALRFLRVEERFDRRRGAAIESQLCERRTDEVSADTPLVRGVRSKPA